VSQGWSMREAGGFVAAGLPVSAGSPMPRTALLAFGVRLGLAGGVRLGLAGGVRLGLAGGVGGPGRRGRGCMTRQCARGVAGLTGDAPPRCITRQASGLASSLTRDAPLRSSLAGGVSRQPLGIGRGVSCEPPYGWSPRISS
jgi:hypothetical protein